MAKKVKVDLRVPKETAEFVQEIAKTAHVSVDEVVCVLLAMSLVVKKKQEGV